MSLRIVFIGCTVLFAILPLLLLPTRVREPESDTYQSDALEYHTGAVHLLLHGKYSIPTSEREPGYSLFLVPVYVIFGIGNRAAVYLMQGLLYLVVSLWFAMELSKHAFTRSSRPETSSQPGMAALVLLLLVTLPAAIHANFWPLRESLALSLMLLMTASLLRLKRTGTWWSAIIGGLSLGWLILTYMPFLFLPLFLLPLLWLWQLPRARFTTTLLIAIAMVSLWGLRNLRTQGIFSLSGTHRPAAIWYGRGEQAEQVRGLEPLRCLIAEYITRDWTGRSPACSFNRLMHEKWPGGVFDPATDLQIARESKAKIIQHFGNYLWFSVFEILELHLPYVNGWGRIYNLLAVLSQLALLIGMLLGLPQIIRRWRELAPFLLIPLYTTLVFMLTDAIPRYLVPAIGCYVVLAAIGYSRVIRDQGSSLRPSA